MWSFSSCESRGVGGKSRHCCANPQTAADFTGPARLLLHLGPAAPSQILGCCDSSAWTEFGSTSELWLFSVHNIKVVFVNDFNVQGRETSRSCYMFCWAFPAQKGGREGENAFAKTYGLSKKGQWVLCSPSTLLHTRRHQWEAGSTVANLVPGNVAQYQTHRTKEWFPAPPMEYILWSLIVCSKTRQLRVQPRQHQLSRNRGIFSTLL